MKRYNKALWSVNTKTYFLDRYCAMDFYIDIVSIVKIENSMYECWIYSDKYGIKELVFGMDQQSVTFNEFKKLSFKNALMHMAQYEFDYRQ